MSNNKDLNTMYFDIVRIEQRIDKLLDHLQYEYPASIKDIIVEHLENHTRASSRLLGVYSCLKTREISQSLDIEEGKKEEANMADIANLTNYFGSY